LQSPNKISSFSFPFYKLVIWALFILFLLLTWIGACPVEAPYIKISQLLTLAYFLFFIFIIY
jgi:ubiquinol-cytochrome c reductase cytochrome b subunit